MRAIKYWFIREFFASCDWMCDQAEECSWPYLWVTLVVASLVLGVGVAIVNGFYELIY